MFPPAEETFDTSTAYIPETHGMIGYILFQNNTTSYRTVLRIIIHVSAAEKVYDSPCLRLEN